MRIADLAIESIWSADVKQISNCPICGLAFKEPVDEEELRYSYWICECCGCEYGYDDTPQYREHWIKQGAKWFIENARPANWNLAEQLKNIVPGWNKD
jgi:hypothetical protein